MSNQWSDDVMNGIDRIKKFLDYVIKERAQLYGIIIHLMVLLKENRIELPPFPRMVAYGEDYYILVDNDEDKYYVNMLEREQDEDEILD